MKQIKTAPDNRAFFDEHGGSLAAYGLIGFLGQLLSGLSLAYAVFALLVAQVFAAGEVDAAAFLVLVSLAVTVGFFVELANRVLARRAIRPFVEKDLFADDAETQRRHKILNRSYLVGLVAVAGLSYFFSVVGSTYYAEDATAGAEVIEVDSIADAFQLREAAVLRSFTADSATVATPYSVQLAAARTIFAADSSTLMRQRDNFASCARKGNKWCKSKQREYLSQLDRKRAELATATAQISRERSAALAAILTNRDEQLVSLRAGRATDIEEAKAVNREAGEERDSDAGFKALVFIVLTIAGQTLFYFVTYLQLQIEAGSKIKYQIDPNEFWALPTILQEFRTTAAWRFERGARRLIRQLFGEPDDSQKTAIPYASLYDSDSKTDIIDGAVTNGPVIAVKVSENGETPNGRTVVVDSAVKQCRNCGKDYRPKAHNQRYCTTSCKTDYHTKKNNGQSFDPGKYRGRKRSKA